MSITKEDVLKMDLKSIFTAVKAPDTKAEMQVLLKDRAVAVHVSDLMKEAQQREDEVDSQLARVVPPSTEALAAEATAMVAETPVVAEAVVPPVEAVAPAAKIYEAEDAALKAIGVTVVRDANGNATRYIEEYHVTAEDGTKIGRATHLEARSLPELLAKKQEVHTQATRAFHRLKQQKLSFKPEPKTILSPEQIQEAARLALEAKDPTKVTDVIEQVIETKYKQREQEIKDQAEQQKGKAISNQFMRRHLHDYNPCEANNKLMGEYFDEHNLLYTLDNLEAAFVALSDDNKLVKVVPTFQTPVAEVANPTPATTVAAPAAPVLPVAEVPAAVPASAAPAQPSAPSQPVVEATATTPAVVPNAQQPARRPAVSGGIAPGSLSAQRPGTPNPALTRKEFLGMVNRMDPKVMKQKLATDPQFVKQLEAYGIKVR
jgi:hypothetical protein